jgi:hypothetical protein
MNSFQDLLAFMYRNVCMYLCMYVVEPVCYKKHQKKFLTSYWFIDSEWYEIDHG